MSVRTKCSSITLLASRDRFSALRRSEDLRCADWRWCSQVSRSSPDSSMTDRSERSTTITLGGRRALLAEWVAVVPGGGGMPSGGAVGAGTAPIPL